MLAVPGTVLVGWLSYIADKPTHTCCLQREVNPAAPLPPTLTVQPARSRASIQLLYSACTSVLSRMRLTP